MTGQLLGHYRVLEQIGAGGMGEVFRARDERLGRDVALKFVRPTNSNPDRLQRFEQEARAAAALNHPNIVAIYDIGFHEGSPYIVSELLEGQNLRQRLAEGLLTIKQVSDYSLQIARGLVAAHAGHIIHRDLKPENVFLTRDGRIKILDFGVAKLQPPTPESGQHSVQTMTTVTKVGSVIGTVAYMAPEQLRGKAVDGRSDIFSFGSILYEMLTGRRAFHGETEVDTMTAVLREDPPEIEVEDSRVPVAFRQVVTHCLEKEPQDRFQSARDLAFALETVSSLPSGRSLARIVARKGRTARSLAWALAAMVCAASLLLGGRWLNPNVSDPVFRRITFEQGTVYSARFTPDGQSIIYGAAWNGRPLQLYSTVADSPLAQSLNLADARLLAISRSDELAIGLHGVHMAHLETENGTLASAPLAGGSPRELLQDVHWADWDAKGGLAVVHHAEGHSRLEYPIGHVLYESGGWISHIRISPQGDKIAFLDHPALWDDRGSVCIVDMSGHVSVLSSGWGSEDGLAWNVSEKEIWFTAAEKGYNRSLMAVNLAGRVRRVLAAPGGLTLQDLASDGRVLMTFDAERIAMAATDRNGKTVTDLSWHDWNLAKDISGDGQWVLFEDASEAAGPNYSVALRKLDGSAPERLGDGSAGGLSPDGRWAISVFTGTPEQLALLPAGAGQPRLIKTPGLEHIQNGSARFLLDGKRIIVNGSEPHHSVRCYLLDLLGGTLRPITPEGIEGGRVSPDGRYVTSISASSEVDIYPLDGGRPRPVPGLDPGFTPIQWSEDSSALYVYRSGELPAKIYEVEIASGKKKLIQELLPLGPAGVVSVAPVVTNRDGSRFVFSFYQDLSVLYVVSGVR
jgi:serine/threonine protein kinase